MKKTFIAFVVSTFALLSLISARGGGEVFVPNPTWVNHMVRNLADERYDKHRTSGALAGPNPALYVQLETDERDEEGKGATAHFFIWSNEVGPRWQIADMEAREDGSSGTRITVWEFSLDVPEAAVTWESITGEEDGKRRPIRRITPASSEWTQAMEQSRRAWEMLCKTFSCLPSA